MDQVRSLSGLRFRHGREERQRQPGGLDVIMQVTPVQSGSGGSGNFTLTQIQSTEPLESHLRISAEASGGVGLFSASARFDFAKSCKV